MFGTESGIEGVSCKDCVLHGPDIDNTIKRGVCNHSFPLFKSGDVGERSSTQGNEYCAFGVQRRTGKVFLEIIIASQTSS